MPPPVPPPPILTPLRLGIAIEMPDFHFWPGILQFEAFPFALSADTAVDDGLNRFNRDAGKLGQSKQVLQPNETVFVLL